MRGMEELVLSKVALPDTFNEKLATSRTTQQPSRHSSGFHQFESIDHLYGRPGIFHPWPGIFYQWPGIFYERPGFL